MHTCLFVAIVSLQYILLVSIDRYVSSDHTVANYTHLLLFLLLLL